MSSVGVHHRTLSNIMSKYWPGSESTRRGENRILEGETLHEYTMLESLIAQQA
jgi:hypothetical protein